MLDAWKDCEVLNTHEGQIILPRSSEATNTHIFRGPLPAGIVPQGAANTRRGADLLPR